MDPNRKPFMEGRSAERFADEISRQRLAEKGGGKPKTGAGTPGHDEKAGTQDQQRRHGESDA
jgi:hypothetical protein